VTYLLLAIGIVILLGGGELLVRHASRLALTLGMAPLVVGLTVVAFGTSAPELMTSVYSQFIGEGAVALGNVVGSNTFNVLAILGISAVIAPLQVNTRLLRIDVPLVLAISVVVVGFAYSGTIGRWESLALLTMLIAYITWALRAAAEPQESGLNEIEDAGEVVSEPPGHWSVSVALTLAGLGLIILGGRMFVSGAVEVARAWQIDETVIGLTVVSAGTSLPELVSSMLASLRGHRDIAIGNVVGSNLFNMTGVLGLSGLVGPTPLTVAPNLLKFDLPVMVATAAICLPIMFSGGRIQRWEGGVLVVYYVGYVTYLVLSQTGHMSAPTFGAAMAWFVIPMSILTLMVVGFRDHGSA
jgi:cation:H+ antiporter